MPFIIPRQNSLFCFSPLPLYALPEWIRIGGSFSTYPYGMHQVVSAICFSLLGEIPSQKGIFPKRNLVKNLKIGPIFSPPLNHTLWIPWPRAHLSYIGKVQVGGALARVSSTILCVCLLLLPCHFCPSCIVSFCCVSWVHAYSHGVNSVGS